MCGCISLWVNMKSITETGIIGKSIQTWGLGEGGAVWEKTPLLAPRTGTGAGKVYLWPRPLYIG